LLLPSMEWGHIYWSLQINLPNLARGFRPEGRGVIKGSTSTSGL
jgi:hypothetical protein